MKTKQNIFGIGTRWALFGLIFLPSLQASDFDKKTSILLREPMQIPGLVLPAGDYVIKRADASLPNVIRFTNANETEVFATVQTIPTYRSKTTSNVEIVTEERPAGAPEALKKWFYPGDIAGAEFVYPKSNLIAAATVPSSLERREATPTPTQSSLDEEAVYYPVAEEEEPIEIAQARSSPAPEPGAVQSGSAGTRAVRAPASVQEELPETASSLPLASLLGGIAVFGGAVLRRFSRRSA
jgi:hypothetical protein